MRSGLAPRTLKSYDAAWAQYSAFCNHFSLPVHPVNISVVCAFISSRVDSTNIQYSSVSSLIAGIQFHARCLDPSTGSLFSNPSVRLLLQGIKRERPCRRDSRLPLSVQSLYSMVSLLRKGRFGPFMDAMLEAVILTAFFGFLRLGEFTSETNKFDCQSNLCIDDISWGHQCLFINLKRSKSDKERKGCSVAIARSNSKFCPFSSLYHYLGLRKASSANEPLFVSHSGLPMSRAWFASRFRLLCSWCGLDPKRYTPHSLRIGGATAMAQFVSPATLKSMGRWSSSAFERYVRPSPNDVINAQILLSRSHIFSGDR